ncbi:flagellar assembly protein T N-terminal domain-containing protein [Gemmatimonadota bacterium]
MSGNRYLQQAALLVLALGLILPTPSQAQDVPQEGRMVTVQGYGSIVAGDRAKARDDAIADAMRNAVEQVMGTHVQSSTITENFMLIQDNIYTQTSGYISTYEVTNEMEDTDMITITMRATVKESQLVSDLEAIGVLMARMNYPRLLVLIDEQIFVDEGGEERVPTTIDNATTTTLFMEMLQPKGFRFVDPTTVAMNTQASVLQSALEGDVAQAVTIGRAHQAEVIVLGTTIAKRGTAAQRFLGDTVSMSVSISMRILRSDTGEIMATSAENDAGVGISPVDASARGIRRTMDKLGPRLEEMILEQWNAEVMGSRVVELHIVNQIGFMQLQQFRQLLPYYVRGVEEVTQKSFLEGLAVLEVRSGSDAMGLATELSSKLWEEFTIEVTGVTANQVRIRVTPKEPQ